MLGGIKVKVERRRTEKWRKRIRYG